MEGGREERQKDTLRGGLRFVAGASRLVVSGRFEFASLPRRGGEGEGGRGRGFEYLRGTRFGLGGGSIGALSSKRFWPS
jgi:hypothetical protein